MRATLEQSLPDSCVIERRTLASDGQGGGSETWTALGTVSCRLSPEKRSGEEEYVRADSMAEERNRILTVPHGTAIEGRDRVTTGGATYEVSSVDAPMSWEIDRRVDVVEVK